MESYISTNMSRNKRCLISRLRLGVLAIEVELGRFNNVVREHRICKLCKKGVEDKLHLLFQCEKLIKPRTDLFMNQPELLSLNSNINRLIFLTKHPYVFGNYMLKLWNVRIEVLNNS